MTDNSGGLVALSLGPTCSHALLVGCVCSFFPQGTFSLIIEALHTDSPDDLTTGKCPETHFSP